MISKARRNKATEGSCLIVKESLCSEAGVVGVAESSYRSSRDGDKGDRGANGFEKATAAVLKAYIVRKLRFYLEMCYFQKSVRQVLVLGSVG